MKYENDTEILNFISMYDGTSIGQTVKNMYENEQSEESIMDVIDNCY